jgi:hypothetical protein
MRRAAAVNNTNLVAVVQTEMKETLRAEYKEVLANHAICEKNKIRALGF